MPLELLVDDFARNVARTVSVTTTTTTETPTTSTSTTTAPPLGPHYTFTSAPGTANCGTAFSPSEPPSSAPSTPTSIR